MLNNTIGIKKRGTTEARKSSYDSYDYFSFYRKNGGRLTRKQYVYVINQMNKIFADELAMGKDLILPYSLGVLRHRKKKRGLYFEDGKLKNNYKVDWGATKKLWREDEQAYNDKVLIKNQYEYSFRVEWVKGQHRIKNLSAYKFIPTRSLKLKNRENVFAKNADALNYTQKKKLL